MSRIGDWFRQRGENFKERWTQHPGQQVAKLLASRIPGGGIAAQKGFDYINNRQGMQQAARGQALGDAMQQSLDQRIWGNPSPPPMTENYGPWAGGYRGAQTPPVGGDNIAQTLGLPDYNGDQVPNSPAQVPPAQPTDPAAEPPAQQQTGRLPRYMPMFIDADHTGGYSSGGGHGSGWADTDADVGKMNFFQQGPGIGGKIDLGSLAEAMAQRYMARQTK